MLLFLLSRFLIASGKVGKVKKRAANGDFILSVYFHDPSKKLFESCVKMVPKKKDIHLFLQMNLQLLQGEKNHFQKLQLFLLLMMGGAAIKKILRQLQTVTRYLLLFLHPHSPLLPVRHTGGLILLLQIKRDWLASLFQL